MSYPMFMYHRELAVDGKFIHTAEDFPTGEGWVDTPAAFAADYVAPPKRVVREGDGAVALESMGIARVRYPAHFYRKGDHDNPVTVVSEEEELALDHDVWKDTPDPKAWDEVKPAPADISGAFSAFVNPDVQTDRAPAPPPPPPVFVLTAEEKEKLYKATVAELLPMIDAVERVDQLRAIAVAEMNNPTAERKTIVRALAVRMKALKVTAE